MTKSSKYTSTTNTTSYNNDRENDDQSDDFAPMDGNDPLTQFFLQITDEAVNERQRMATTSGAKNDAQKQSVAEALLEMLPSQTSASEATYEGDDESEAQSSLAKTQSRSSKTQGDQESDNVDQDDDNQALALATTTRNTRTIATTTHSKKNPKNQKASLEHGPVTVHDISSRSYSSETNKAEIQVKHDALDFVHVHLEHISSHDNEDDNDDEDNEDIEVMGPMPLSRKGSQSKQDPPNQTAKLSGKQSETNKEAASRSASPASGYRMVSDQDGTTGNSFTYYRKFASEGSSSLPNSSSNVEAPVTKTGSSLTQQQKQKQKRSNPLVASLQHALSFGSTNNHTQVSSVGNSEMATCRKASKNHMNNLANNSIMTRKQFLSLSPSEEAKTGKGKGKGKQTSDSLEDTAFDFVNLNVTTPVVTINSSTSVATDQHPTNSQSSAATDHHNNRENKTIDKSHGKVAFSDCEDNLQSSVDKKDWNRRHHYAAGKDQFYNTSDTDNSEDDDRRNNRRTNHYQRKHYKKYYAGTPHPDDPNGEYRMTLLQTIQHNTRANFCAIFLLGVALATLILLIVAKLTNSHERLFYDDEEDQHIVITNNEQLLTIEVLAFALIMVLLVGSMCYCGVATWDSAKNRYSRHQRDSLVHQVKHEDACFANSSGRRKNPSYKAPYITDSPRTISQSQSQPTCGNNDEKENIGETGDRTTAHGLENQTFSMLSSTTEQTHDDNDEDDVLISMEEADQYYEELEEQARCCSPLSINSNSTTEPYVDVEDEDDFEDEESRSHHQGRGGRKKKGFFS